MYKVHILTWKNGSPTTVDSGLWGDTLDAAKRQAIARAESDQLRMESCIWILKDDNTSPCSILHIYGDRTPKWEDLNAD